VFLACVLGAFLLYVFWWERADRLLVNTCLWKMRSSLLPERRVRRMELGECSLSALKDRASVDLASVDFLPYKPPTLYWAGVWGETSSG
jgi:hypothetical protein